MNFVDLSVYLVTNRDCCLGRDLEEIVLEAVAGGCSLVQLREKDTDTGKFVALARALRKKLKPLGIPLLINDRVDVALAAEADGVHVGQSDMHPMDVRRLIGEKALLGLSVDTEEELEIAQSLPVDYLGIGPVFPTDTKKDIKGSVWGVEGLQKAARQSRIPLVGIGGVQLENAQAVVSSGIAGVAVVSAICSAKSPRQAANDLKKAVLNGRQAG